MRQLLIHVLLVFVFVFTELSGSISRAAEQQADTSIEAVVQEQGVARVVAMFKPVSRTAFDIQLSDAERMAQIHSVREQILTQLGGSVRVQRIFNLIPAIALQVDRAGLRRLRAHPLIEHLMLDLPGELHMSQGGALANIPAVLAAGQTGVVSKIAILDSGINSSHADFAGRIVGEHCLCSGPAGAVGCCPNGMDTQAGTGSAADGNGHGTNVSGVAASGGAISAPGAALAANIVAVRVTDNNGEFCCISDVAAGFDWVRINHPDTAVLNASLGTTALFEGGCDDAFPLMTAAVDNLVSNGTMVFVSSGNQGSASRTASPACIENAVSVGAVWDVAAANVTFLGCTEAMAQPGLPTCFTNSNAAVDLFAPGAFITSSGVGGGTSTFGGTSQASPMTAGCAAAIRAAFPALPVAQLRAALTASPAVVTDPKNGLSFPRLDCRDAFERLQLLDVVFTDQFEV